FMKLAPQNGGIEQPGAGTATGGISCSATIATVASLNNMGVGGTTANFTIDGENFRGYPVQTTSLSIEAVGQDIENGVHATTNEARSPANTEGYTSFVAVPDRAHSRLVLVSGSFGTGSSVIVDSSASNNFATIAVMGSNNYAGGAIETVGKPNNTLSIGDLVIRGTNGANLLLGMSTANLQVNGSTITVDLTNVLGSGTSAPSFIWADDGTLGFIADRALIPQVATAQFTNLAGSSNVV